MVTTVTLPYDTELHFDMLYIKTYNYLFLYVFFDTPKLLEVSFPTLIFTYVSFAHITLFDYVLNIDISAFFTFHISILLSIYIVTSSSRQQTRVFFYQVILSELTAYCSHHQVKYCLKHSPKVSYKVEKHKKITGECLKCKLQTQRGRL